MILLFMPHLDDETFSAFGVLAKGVDAKHVVTFCKGGTYPSGDVDARLAVTQEISRRIPFKHDILSYPDLSLPMVPMSELVGVIDGYLNHYDVCDVVTVSENDLHQDHRAVSHAVKISCKRHLDKVRTLLEMKQPMNNFDRTEYDDYINLLDTPKQEYCALYQVRQPEYFDKEIYRVLYAKN